MARSVLGLALAIAALRLSAGSDVVLRSEADEDEAREWLEGIEDASETLLKAAKFFKSLDEKSSPVYVNSLHLIGSIATLVTGFMGDPTTENYVKEIQGLQTAVNGKIDEIQTAMNLLIADIEYDFVKLYLVPRVTTLMSALTFLTAFTQEDEKTDAVKNTFAVQMDPIKTYTEAWNDVVDCFLGAASICPDDMLNLVLNDGVGYMRPAVLVRFSLFHYHLLATSATAISARNTMLGYTDETGVDLTKLVEVAEVLSQAHTAMIATYEATAAGTLPGMMMSIIDANANRGHDGAVDIRDQIKAELNTYWFAEDLDEFWNAKQWSLTIWKSGRDAVWWTTIRTSLVSYQGYSVMWATANSDDGGVGISDSACTTIDDYGYNYGCICDLGAENRLVYEDNDGENFFALASKGSYYNSFGSSCCKLHVVTPGYKLSGYTAGQEQDIVVLDGYSGGKAALIV